MIVMMCGRKRSGKNTAADILTSRYGFTQYAFADPIKKACKIIFLLTEEQIDGSLKEVIDPRWNMPPREMYQYVGSELFRISLPKLSEGFNATIGDKLWVIRFLEWYKMNKDKVTDVVITDCRFLNELETVRNTFKDECVSIRISRDDINNEDTHMSEIEIESLPVDYEIKNSGTIEELHDKVLTTLQKPLLDYIPLY